MRRNRIISRSTLVEFWKKHPKAKDPLSAWYEEAKKSFWTEPKIIKERYRSADFLPGNRVVFNIGGNNYRIIVKIEYKFGGVFIRFVGTHSEYDKINAETI
ncbi:type II toxin-antitoxin system HigB family toxin [Leptospira dzoumogneensis]|uniref:Type II toxin-antitoxin system HigB family toxin n=1 Tax=Leptospira dzoumogneensis TaxID=2484904 RepID=A0A4Z1AH26_9LEPT|nr:type II toxin-antitoxin system HigB family toxin [Leptospira dzoumogneensis]TGN03353.1 type II toxin-antitoxin system HigB family toxin [Leptospira dzoumogneensis]